MLRFPFISRASHAETIAAKDETIALLRATNATLLEAITRKPEPVPAETAAAPPIPRVRAERHRSVDLASVDPTDNAALTRIAMGELGTGARSASMVQRKIESLRNQAIQARQGQKKKREQPGVLSSETPPDDIQRRIDEAVMQGQKDARG